MTDLASLRRYMERNLPVIGVAIAVTVFIVARVPPDETNADFWMFPIMSTSKVTLFYWGQNRMANLVPALAYPIRDAYSNARACMFIGGFALIGALGLIHRIAFDGLKTFRENALSGAGFAVSGGTFIWLFEPRAVYSFAFEQPYGISLFTYAIGCALIVSRKHLAIRLLGVPLLIIALAVNPSSVLFLGMVIPIAIGQKRIRSLLIAIPANLLGLAFIVSASKAAEIGEPTVSYFSVQLSNPWKHIYFVIETYWSLIPNHLLLVPLMVGSAAAIWANWRHLPRNAKLLATFSPAFTLAWTLTMSTNGWVRFNETHYRYFFPIYLVIFVLLTIGVTSVFHLAARSAPSIGRIAVAIPVAVVGALLVSSAVMWQPISDYQTIKAYTGFIDYGVEHDVAFVGGNYWDTWPTVLGIREAGKVVYGFAPRGAVMRKEINQESDRRTRENPSMQIMCMNTDATSCLTLFNATTERIWIMTGVISESPLVISIKRQS